MINDINNEILSNINYELAENIFQKYLDKCEIIKKKYVEPTSLKISTITLSGSIGESINSENLYNNINANNQIIYIEYGSNIKGVKRKKKKKILVNKKRKLDKRKLGKGKSFSNQISIGIKGFEGIHKNAIDVKLFKNGSIHMAGCKSLNESEKVYKYIYNIINNIQTDEKILIQNMKIFNKNNINIKMINSSFKTNFEINQINLLNLIKKKYKENDIFTSFNSCNSSPIRIYLKYLSIYDKSKNKMKKPSVFIYRSGSINVVVPDITLLYTTYDFINDFLKTNFEQIYQKDINLYKITN